MHVTSIRVFFSLHFLFLWVVERRKLWDYLHSNTWMWCDETTGMSKNGRVKIVIAVHKQTTSNSLCFKKKNVNRKNDASENWTSRDCISLLSIATSSSVARNKEKSAFSEYSRLRNVVRSKAVQSISKSAFADCVGKISETRDSYICVLLFRTKKGIKWV